MRNMTAGTRPRESCRGYFGTTVTAVNLSLLAKDEGNSSEEPKRPDLRWQNSGKGHDRMGLLLLLRWLSTRGTC